MGRTLLHDVTTRLEKSVKYTELLLCEKTVRSTKEDRYELTHSHSSCCLSSLFSVSASVESPQWQSGVRLCVCSSSGEDEGEVIHMGNAIMSFYSALIDLLGRCAPEMHVRLWSAICAAITFPTLMCRRPHKVGRVCRGPIMNQYEAQQTPCKVDSAQPIKSEDILCVFENGRLQQRHTKKWEKFSCLLLIKQNKFIPPWIIVLCAQHLSLSFQHIISVAINICT